MKSIALDSWSYKEAALMALGGNSKSKAFFEEQGVSKGSIRERYTSDAAKVNKQIDMTAFPIEYSLPLKNQYVFISGPKI